MKAIQVHEKGGSEVLEINNNVDSPVLRENEILIENHFAGINFIDIYFREGLYPVERHPYTPGKEGSGVVVKVGTEVNRFKIGDRVAYPFAGTGSYAEYTAAPEQNVVKLPDAVPFDIGAAAMLQGLTAHYLSNSSYSIKENDHILVHAAAGGVGLLLVQMAKAKGAKVFGTVSTKAKKELALKAGADDVILYDDHQFEDQLMELTDGKKMDVVYDSVGKSTFDQSLIVTRPRGMVVLFGQSSGVVPPFDLNRLNTSGSLFITRPSLGHYIATVEELDKRSSDIFTMVSSNDLNVHIGKTYPLDDVAKAHDDLVARKTTGKLLLQIK